MQQTQKSIFILMSPVLYGIGIGAYFALLQEPPVWYGVIPAVLSLFLLLFLNWKKKEFRFVGMALLLISTGFLVAQIRTALVQAPVLSKALGPVQITGDIESLEWLEKGKSARLILNNLAIERLPKEGTPYRIRLKIYDGLALEPGQRISVFGKLNPPGPPVSPGAFDFQQHAYFRKIGAVGFAFGTPEILKEKGEGFFSLAGVRHAIALKIKDTLSGKEQSLALALITGQRSSIKEETWEAMRSAGLAHMLAISGLHVGMVAGILFFFFRLCMAFVPALALKHPIKKYAAFIALVGSFLYMLLVGAPVTTQRAMLMTGFALIAIMLDRSPFSLRLVALSALAILTFFPESLLSAGFQMSFAAVTSLIAFYDALRPYWSRLRSQAGWFKRGMLYVMGICTTTIVASIATAPFSIYHFQHFAPFGLAGNILAVPVMGFLVMPCAVAFLILCWVPVLNILPLKVMGWGISLIIVVADMVTTLPHANMLVPTYPFSAFLLIVSGGLFWCILKGSYRALSLLPLLLSLPVFLLSNQEDIKISSDGKLILLAAQNDTYLISSRVSARFTRENWSRMKGLERDDLTVFPKEGEASGLQCNEELCRFEKDGYKVSILETAYPAYEECQWADLIIARKPLPYSTKRHCNASVVLDKFDFWKEGAHDIFLLSDTITVRTTASSRGIRPWTNHKKRKARSRQKRDKHVDIQ